ncbi:hypothetical protein LOTGIDRAFT_154578 [Lottia gigantea]|uniref:Uncharacterized protein n=1 Tax=Lottia gigantea TaxID=225164 RepID=V3Z895_LOTGI|nr:hypothetical protein LOTGIDRAFT_154578 [Lottia gigantea]ESO87088.1 hypothetical protein LOTGIDRAFT_154578 [Lottia gigantea]
MVAPTTPTRIFLGSPDDLLEEVIVDTGTHRDYEYGVDDNEEFQNSNADDVNEDPDYEPDKDETTTDGRLDDRIKQPSTKKHKPNLESDHPIREPCKRLAFRRIPSTESIQLLAFRSTKGFSPF